MSRVPLTLSFFFICATKHFYKMNTIDMPISASGSLILAVNPLIWCQRNVDLLLTLSVNLMSAKCGFAPFRCNALRDSEWLEAWLGSYCTSKRPAKATNGTLAVWIHSESTTLRDNKRFCTSLVAYTGMGFGPGGGGGVVLLTGLVEECSMVVEIFRRFWSKKKCSV